LASHEFSQKKENELSQANLRAKPKTILTSNKPIIFNGGVLSMEGETIVLH
jgi:hypothetical protein